jgi:hypothetical protein
VISVASSFRSCFGLILTLTVKIVNKKREEKSQLTVGEQPQLLPARTLKLCSFRKGIENPLNNYPVRFASMFALY